VAGKALDKLNRKIEAAQPPADEQSGPISTNEPNENPCPLTVVEPVTPPRKKRKKTSALDRLTFTPATKSDPGTDPKPSETILTEEPPKEISENNDNNPEPFDYDRYEKELETQASALDRKRVRREKFKSFFGKMLSAILALGCVYMIFLIYGAIKTEYAYDEDGKVVAQTLTVQQIEELSEFDKVAKEYYKVRGLYETVLRLDYRVAAGIEDPLVIAPEYDKALETVEKLVLSVQALTSSSKYTQVQAMLLSWVKTDIAVYCQRMSEAISQNNPEYAAQAIQFRQRSYNDFGIITENLVALGSTVHGAEIYNISQWSPENYIRDNVDRLSGASPSLFRYEEN